MTMFTTEVEPEIDGAMQLWLTDPDAPFDTTSMRLSTECVCRRVREWVQPDLYRAFPQYLDARGHGFEAIVAANLERTGHVFYREAKVPWAHGESGIDFLIVSGPMCDEAGGPIIRELKANKGAELRSENRRQVQRQRRCVELALEQGLPIMATSINDGKPGNVSEVVRGVGDRWAVLVLDPVTWRIPNPTGYAVPLDDERRTEIDAELAETDRYAAIAGTLNAEWEMDWPTCTCGSCWPPPIDQLPAELEGAVAAYIEARDEAAFGENEKKRLMQQIREGITRRAEHLGYDADDPRRAWEGVHFKVGVSKNGRMTPGRIKR